MKSCIFSGMDADTQEHVIPDWVQHRFDLHRATYALPNASSLHYRHAKVPAAKHFNKFFGNIETRISQNKFVWEEVYLWLFKIHIGLMYRNTSLRANIRSHSESIVHNEFILRQLDIFRRMVKSYMNTGNLDIPISPPGSVFILESLSGRYFDFQHSFTTGCVGINIGDFYLAASLWDFQTAKDFGYFDWVWSKDNYGSPPARSTTEEIAAWYHHAQAIWLCNLGYWSFRWNINMYKTRTEIALGNPAFEDLPRQRAEDPRELALICQTFGLELIEFRPDGKSVFGVLPSRKRAREHR
jgi:hypothetical protein